jgi:hypothetical protein
VSEYDKQAERTFIGMLPEPAQEVMHEVLAEIEATEYNMAQDNDGAGPGTKDFAMDILTRLARAYFPDHPDLYALTD